MVPTFLQPPVPILPPKKEIWEHNNSSSIYSKIRLNSDWSSIACMWKKKKSIFYLFVITM